MLASRIRVACLGLIVMEEKWMQIADVGSSKLPASTLVRAGGPRVRESDAPRRQKEDSLWEVPNAPVRSNAVRRLRRCCSRPSLRRCQRKMC